MAMKALPNILSTGRLVLTLLMFVALAAAAGDLPILRDRLTPETTAMLLRWSFWAFVVAAVTDYFDGWLARKLDAVTVWGAILILFREFTVSALREVGAAKGIKLPVTTLAKWKTTLQLIALGAELLVAAWAAFGIDPSGLANMALAAHTLLWVATLITLITGYQYWNQTRLALKG
jgi:phosphatidylglycerophosphate synthase